MENEGEEYTQPQSQENESMRYLQTVLLISERYMSEYMHTAVFCFPLQIAQQ